MNSERIYVEPADDQSEFARSYNQNKTITRSSKLNSSFIIESKTIPLFLMKAYIVTKIINSSKHIYVDAITKQTFEYEYKKYIEIYTKGTICFIFRDKLCVCDCYGGSWQFKFSSSEDISDLKLYIESLIISDNPYKNKLLYYVDPNVIEMKPVPTIELDDVIMNDVMKADIYDNTIFYLKNLKSSNGIILHGVPGVGKSLICSAVTNKAIDEGYSVIYLTHQVYFNSLESFINDCVQDCVVILEDIDTFAQSRDSKDNIMISEFLQFLNGITENENNIIFIATTNYLDKLDEAISNRPVRFNRKYKFDYPNNNEIDQLVNLYFGEDVALKYSEKCRGLNFTGAHIKEIQRTANLLIAKSADMLTYDDVFVESLELVKSNFSICLNSFGFTE